MFKVFFLRNSTKVKFICMLSDVRCSPFQCIISKSHPCAHLENAIDVVCDVHVENGLNSALYLARGDDELYSVFGSAI